MSKGNAVKLTRALIQSTPFPPSGERRVLWDSQVRGLALVLYPTRRRSWCVYYRTKHGQQRRPKLGDYGVLTIEQARAEARQWLADVARGNDPGGVRRSQRDAPTVADLWTLYWEGHALPHKAKSSSDKDKSNWERHLKKPLGGRPVAEVSRPEMVRLHKAIGRKTPGAANRVIALASKMFSYAEEEGLRSLGTTPCRRIKKFKPKKKFERYLDPEELRRLMALLDKIDRRRAAGEHVTNDRVTLALRLFVYTGCRVSEIVRMRWRELDLARGQLRREETKGGGHVIQLSPPAVALLKAIPRRNGNPYVLTAPKTRRRRADDLTWRATHLPISTLGSAWNRMRAKIDLQDVRIHDLRHNFASLAADNGASLKVIGGLLGHKSALTTERYAHLTDRRMRKAAEAVADAILDATKAEDNVVPFASGKEPRGGG